MIDIDFSENVLKKADGLIADEKVRTDECAVNVFWVSGSSDKPYRVQTDEETWITCTCRHAQTRGGMPRCAHVAAVLKEYFPDSITS